MKNYWKDESNIDKTRMAVDEYDCTVVQVVSHNCEKPGNFFLTHTLTCTNIVVKFIVLLLYLVRVCILV